MSLNHTLLFIFITKKTLFYCKNTCASGRGIYIDSTGGITKVNVYGGTITAVSNYAVQINSAGSATLTLGSSGGTFNATSPRLIDIGGSYAIRTGGSGVTRWNWYSGDLYGTASARGYYNAASVIRTNYGSTISSTTAYMTGGYRTYLVSAYTINFAKGSNVTSIEKTQESIDSCIL